jgi:hypothetical protein
MLNVGRKFIWPSDTKMKINRKILSLFMCISFLGKAYTQSTSLPTAIDSICIHIDSLSKSKSFEEFDFSINYPNVAVGSRIHFIDTLSNRYKKIIFRSDLDTLTKTFYFEKDRLIEIKIDKNIKTKQVAKYQFKDDVIIYQLDNDHLVTNIKRVVSEAKRYFSLVRY